MTEEQMRSIFEMAEIKVHKCWEMMNQYWPRPYQDMIVNNPWWLVRTDLGLIVIGPRKRVINIDWSDTGIKTNVTSDNVTCSETMVHAWTKEKAVEYLTNLKNSVK